jgi:ribonuclease HI
MSIHIHTDGSNHGGEKFGWGFVVSNEAGDVLATCYGAGIHNPEWSSAWNVAAECTAVIRALGKIKPEQSIVLFHDYMGLGCWARGEWKVKSQCARGYVAELKALSRHVEFRHVQGHAGDKFNELADKLARQGLTEQPDKPVFCKR